MEFVGATETQETMSLDEILAEIGGIMAKIQNDEPYDNNRLEVLVQMQEQCPEFRAQVADEYERWRDEINIFCSQCLNTMRSFVPPAIFSATFEALVAMDLPEDIARRILQKPCLWLTRMSTEEIARMHIADLNAKYAVTSQNLDIIELASVYFSLPERFHNDSAGKKLEWRESIERLLKDMIEEKDADCLPKQKMRHPVYTGLKRGPVHDLNTVKDFEVVRGDSDQGPRKSFQEVCSRHSLLGKMKNLDASTKAAVVAALDTTVDGEAEDYVETA